MRSINPDLPRYPTLIHVLAEAIHRVPEHDALICSGKTLSYLQLGQAVTGLAAQIREELAADSRIMVMLSNSLEMEIAIFASMAAQAQAIPANPFLTESELRPVLKAAEADMVIYDIRQGEKLLPLLREAGLKHLLAVNLDGSTLSHWLDSGEGNFHTALMPEPHKPGLMFLSGGTTGIPKCVNHLHGALVTTVRQHVHMWPVDFEQERFLSVAPMFHIWGFGYAVMVPTYARSTLVIIPKYNPDEVLKSLHHHHITIFAGGPAPIYMGLLDNPLIRHVDFSHLKYSLSGGAPCPEDLHIRWKEITGCSLFEGWGMSEGAPLCLNPAEAKRKTGSVGIPVPETEIRAVHVDTRSVLAVGEVGEIQVRGPQLTIGYRNNPEETAMLYTDGWLNTGDVGYIDEEGYLFLVDRKKDMVIVGGYNVYPREVDEVLFNHPKIAEAAALGKPDKRLGEVIVAFVVLKPGASMTEEEFFSYCNGKLVKYKRPVEVTFLDALPRTGANKINKRALKATHYG
ncbi:MAG: hypothetical protein A3I78_07270 [Gammaproteobacteria bacterium RIFCSPLOWO2_02_FULL_56_15]|nr:MAG: hypothetical protein A3I78_07270 [Gammaproteobacteria bacterium RIFCSPLOWO2_02_FULL_56_15]